MQSTKQNLELWRKRRHEYQESGLSRRAFCEKIGVKRSTLYYWFASIRKADNDSGLVEIKPRSIASRSDSLTVVIADKYRIEIGIDFNAQLFMEAVKTLEILG